MRSRLRRNRIRSFCVSSSRISLIQSLSREYCSLRLTTIKRHLPQTTEKKRENIELYPAEGRHFLLLAHENNTTDDRCPFFADPDRREGNRAEARAAGEFDGQFFPRVR